MMKKKGNFLGQPWEIRVVPVGSITFNPSLLEAQELLLTVRAVRYFQITATIYDWVFATINAVPAEDATNTAMALEVALKAYITERVEGNEPLEEGLLNIGFNFV